MKKIGWKEVVGNGPYDLSKMSGDDVINLFKQSRFLPLSDKGKESLKRMAGKSGLIYMMHPIGNSNLL